MPLRAVDVSPCGAHVAFGAGRGLSLPPRYLHQRDATLDNVATFVKRPQQVIRQSVSSLGAKERCQHSEAT